MTPSATRVKALLCLYASEEPEPESPRDTLFSSLSEDAWARGEAFLLKRGALSSERIAAAESWCAAEALFELALLDDAAAPASLSVDGLTLNLSGRARLAETLRNEKRKSLERLLGEEDFYFGRT